MRVEVVGDLLVVWLDSEHRCLSSAVLGGGLGVVRTWANLQVPAGYARTDPDAHLREATAGLRGPVVGMMTAAPVGRYRDASVGTARVVATVGLGHPIAAAGAALPAVAGPGTINLFVVTTFALTDAGLAGAVQTVTEAKVQALVSAGVRARNGPGPATGTASDALAVACPHRHPFKQGASEPFAGPASTAGADLAQAVYRAVLEGCRDA